MNEELRQRVIEILRRGDDLPAEWAYELFPVKKKEYELIYSEKEREEDILADTMAVPLQPVRAFGKNGGEWHNKLILGDNLQVLKRLLEDKKAGRLVNADGKPGVRLIYIDPPFATKQEFTGSQEAQAYRDKIIGSQFLEFLRKRLIFLRELLSDDGTLVVHLDIRKGHYCKALLDEIFGEHNFRNEMIWKRTGARSASKTYNHIHDNLFLYTRSSNWIWNVQYTPYSDDYVEKFFTFEDEDGRRYRKTILTAPGTRNGDSGKPWREVNPTDAGRHWAIPGYVRHLLSEEGNSNILIALDELDQLGRIAWPAKEAGVPSFKQYLDDMEGVEIQSIWTDIGPVAANAQEATSYPTQKPEALLSRIILSSSNPGDIVLDAFAGSGTTLAVAEKLNRRWIGIDRGKLSIYTIQKRMLNLKTEIGNNKGKKLACSPFTFYNAGLYDFSSLQQLPWDDWRFFALQLFECKDEPHEVGGLKLDGKRKGASVLVFNYLQYPGQRIDEETIYNLHTQVGSKIGSRLYIIAPRNVFEFQQDYIEFDDVRYYALRIPYSFINELHRREFTALQQPKDENTVNDLVDAEGFDFIQPPKVEWATHIDDYEGSFLKNVTFQITAFETRARLRGVPVSGGLETLSMVLLDLDYNREIFELDDFFYGTELEKNQWQFTIPTENIGHNIMLIFMDIYGNESSEVISRTDLNLPELKNRTSLPE